MAHNILVFWDITEGQKEQIRKTAEGKDCNVVFTTDVEEAKKLAADSEILFGRDMAVIKSASNLKWLCTQTAGVNNYLEDGALPNEECILSCSSGAYGLTISEHITMVSLMMMRQYNAYNAIFNSENWTHTLPMKSLNNCRITLLGTGDIGTTFAKRVKSFEPAKITGVNRRGRVVDPIYDEIVTIDNLDEVLPRTDLLVMSLPGTAETDGLMSAEKLALLPDGAMIVNVGRGNSIDEAALIKELNSARLGGAALDVFSKEPLPLDHELRSAKNVVLTPHNAGWMVLPQTKQIAVNMFCEDLVNYLDGKDLKHRVNRKVGY